MGARGFTDIPSKGLRAGAKAAKCQRRTDWSRQVASAQEQQKAINRLLTEGQKPLAGLRIEAPDVTLSNQVLAGEERRWRATWALKLRRDGRRHWIASHPATRWSDFSCYAATFAKADWISPALNPKILPQIRKQVQRQAKRLPEGSVVTGVIDFCWFRDDLVKVQGWAFHVHLTIQLVGTEEASHLRSIKGAFPYKKAPEAGVSKARVVARAHDTKGWDHYQDKVFQLCGIRQRIVRLDVSGGRCRTHKPPQSREQQLEVARFFQKIRASDLMIWVGHRRYGNQIRRMPCHRSK